MNIDYNAKQYEPYKIPSREDRPEGENDPAGGKAKGGFTVSPEIQRFVEIVIGGSQPARQAEKIPDAAACPVVDEKRKAFAQMRQIAKDNPSLRINHSNFYKPTLLNDMSRVFYKQAVLMKDFEDDFEGNASFTAYYPYYQLMNHEQLRTYFTWRTSVRRGVIKNTSLSYAYVYVYELLNNIGTGGPRDGLNKLMDFRRAFLAHNSSIDKYLLKWVKDYHIYYEMPPFAEFVRENNLSEHFPDSAGSGPDSGGLSLFYDISKYDVRKSAFYTDETRELAENCTAFVISSLKRLFEECGLSFDDFVFPLISGKTAWTPFSRALFYPHIKQRDRRVVFSEKEIYICRQNKWTCGPVTESGRQFIGYIMKQTESALRRAVRFKYKLSVSYDSLGPELRRKLETAGISLEEAINGFVAEFYFKLNRKVISVNVNALEKIRQEALVIQEKLIVQEAEEEACESVPLINHGAETKAQASDGWAGLMRTLTQTELDALSVILQGGDIKRFSDSNGIMAEVLVDGINQKAYDAISDTLLDFGDGATVYEEYIEKLKEAVTADGKASS